MLGSPMRDFDDVVKAQPMEIIDHAPGRYFGYENGRFRIEVLLERGSVKMIPMQMGEVNELGMQIVDQARIGFRKIPPTAPVARANQPRIANQAHAIVLGEKTRMAQDREFHDSSIEHGP